MELNGTNSPRACSMSVCNANTKEELENKDSHQALFSFEGMSTRKAYLQEGRRTLAFGVACNSTEKSGRAKRGFCEAKLLKVS